MKKIILSLLALIPTLGSYADETTQEINVIRVYSSERTDDASTSDVDESTFPVAEYQNSSSDKYRAELKDGVISIYRNSETDPINTWINDENKYRVELQKIKVTVDGSDSNSEYVNLGLTSGTLWAKNNVGATKETAYGGYYAWGETTAYGAMPNAYPQNKSMDWTGKTSAGYMECITNGSKGKDVWQTYKWCSTFVSETYETQNTLSKYLDSDNSVLEPTDDAATANWGSNWCMPTLSQETELMNSTTNYSLTLNGVPGWRFVNPSDETRYIFLPAAGWMYTSTLTDEKDNGCYWSKDLSSDTKYEAPQLYFGYSYDFVTDVYSDKRCLGFSVRPIYLTTPVSIVSVDKISLANAEVSVNNSITLNASVSPSDATYSSVTWSSDNTDVATIDVNGVVTGKSAGTANITATATDGSGKSATCTLTAKYINATAISVSDEAIGVDKFVTLKPTFTPENASDKTITSWSSDNEDVATVDENGKVTGHSVGSATITATNGNISTTCTVQVRIPVTRISVTTTEGNDEATISVGGTTTLVATVSPDNATNKNVVWSSLNEGVATVDDNGVVTGVSTGNALIKACAAENAEIYNNIRVYVQ